MEIVAFLEEYWLTLLFYLTVCILIYVNRSKFEFQGKVVAMYKTSLGIKWMQALADRFPRLVRAFGYVGIYAGYLGMVLICFVLVQGLWNVFNRPEALPVIAPVIPGAVIPGTGIQIPLFTGLLSIFLVVIIHEFSHGVVSKAHNVPINSSGFVMFGPIPGAFVEPDEETLKKKSGTVQNAIFAAGPFSNIVSALLLLLLLAFVVQPMALSYFERDGVVISETFPDMPAAQAGIEEGTLITFIDNHSIVSQQDLYDALSNVKPNDTVVLGNNNLNYSLSAAQHPNNSSRGYIGIGPPEQSFEQDGFWASLVLILLNFVDWFFIFSIGLGMANLLPLGPVDGGRMFQIATRRFFGEEKGDDVWAKTSLFVLTLVVLLLLYAIARMFV